MMLLVLGLFVFFSIHSVSMLGDKRQQLIERIGLMPFKGLFSLIALLGFSLIVIGKGSAEFIEIWQPPHAFSMITKLLMLPAWILMIAAYIPSNIKRKVRHPMLLSVKLWAIGHLLINGDLASMLLFGSFLIYGVVAMISANRRSEWVKPEAKPMWMTFLVIIVGLAAYIAIAMFHAQLFGVSIK